MQFKERLKTVPFLGTLAQKSYGLLKRFSHRTPEYWIPRILRGEKATLIQIGSNDGRTGDPLHGLLVRKKKWKALFVEPVPFLFDRLKKNYCGDSRFTFENSVINDGSMMTFYWVAEEAKCEIQKLPSWWDQLGGFNRSHITDHLPELEPFIRQAELPGVTLDGLLDKHQIGQFDLLHIDTEGADFKILSQLDLEKYRPAVILYERKHLSEDEEEASIAFLRDRYLLFRLGSDFLAIDKQAEGALQADKALQAARVGVGLPSRSSL